MSLTSVHPDYTDFLPDWTKMSDCHAGERRIKEAGLKYLPATAGMAADGMAINSPGLLAYQNYLVRARFPDAVKTAVEALVGVMHTKPPTIELPASMERMRDNATDLGESLEVLLRRINEAQLITGRIGLLLDVEDGAPVDTLPYIATYEATDITNWDDGSFDTNLVRKNLNLVILNETGNERTSQFEWEVQQKYRVLVLGDPAENEAQDGSIYRVGVFEDVDAAFNEAELVTPSIGGRSLNEIPFVFINPADIVAKPDFPPLLGLAELSLGIYRGEADYRQALFLQGQDTLVVTGVGTDPPAFRTGAGASIILPTGGTAEFIGVDSSGLSEMRLALENDKAEASQRQGSMVDTSTREAESGDALRIRVVARTATLNQLALTGAFGMQTSLRQAARWIGANPEEVIVIPNLDFVNDTLGGEELLKLVTAKNMGAPISNESIHGLMARKGLTDKTLEEEIDAIEEEEPIGGESTVIDTEDRAEERQLGSEDRSEERSISAEDRAEARDQRANAGGQ